MHLSKISLLYVLMCLLTSCSSAKFLHDGISFDEYHGDDYQREGYYAELIVVQKDNSRATVKFNDEPLGLSERTYEAVRLSPRARDMVVTVEAEGVATTFNITNFVFKPSTRYFIKHNIFEEGVFIRIERKDGKLLFLKGT